MIRRSQFDALTTRVTNLKKENAALQAQNAELHVDYKTQVNAIVDCHDRIETLQARLDAVSPLPDKWRKQGLSWGANILNSTETRIRKEDADKLEAALQETGQ